MSGSFALYKLIPAVKPIHVQLWCGQKWLLYQLSLVPSAGLSGLVGLILFF